MRSLAGVFLGLLLSAAVPAQAGVPGFSISGYLRGPQGEPVSGSVGVYPRHAPGGMVALGQAGADGHYTTDASLQPGEYGLIARSDSGDYISAVYPNVPCMLCDAQGTGSGVAISSQSVGGVDFSLSLAGHISGSFSAPAGLIYNFRLYSASTLQQVTVAPTETTGAYRYDRLMPGSYLVAVESITDPGFLGELYNGVPCYNAYEPCDLLRGTPVTVSAGSLASGIDLYMRSEAVFGDGFE